MPLPVEMVCPLAGDHPQRGVSLSDADPSVYTRTAAVLIKENTKGQSLSSDMGFSDMGLFQSSTNVNNELLVMQSPAIMLEVVKRLHLDMNYLLPGRFHDQVAYGSTLPLTVTMPDLSDNASGQCVIGLHGDGSVELSEFLQNGTEMPVSGPVTGRLLDTLATPLGRIIVQPTPYLKPETEYPAIRVTKANSLRHRQCLLVEAEGLDQRLEGFGHRPDDQRRLDPARRRHPEHPHLGLQRELGAGQEPDRRLDVDVHQRASGHHRAGAGQRRREHLLVQE